MSVIITRYYAIRKQLPNVLLRRKTDKQWWY